MRLPIQRLGRQMKSLSFEYIRRYHTLLPSFLECYAGNLNRPGPVFARESEVFFALVRLVKPNQIIEIGTGGAASTIAFGEALRLNGRGHLLSIDINEKFIERASQIFEVHRLNSHVTFIKGSSSSEAIRQLISAQAKQADILFIDGDHSFDGCLSDFESYRHLLAPEALVIFHDTGPFPLSASDLVARLDLAQNETLPLQVCDGRAIYHRPDVAKAVDWITETYPEYSLLSLHTLVEPCCGVAILQRKQKLFRPKSSSNDVH
jgi:predicted O-methyltransferase YrrM